jgi:hypothetical protein
MAVIVKYTLQGDEVFLSNRDEVFLSNIDFGTEGLTSAG